MSGPDPVNSSRSYRDDIDGLRAVSILSVVLFHAGVDRFAGGYVGVDVFFVVSGFLITGLLLREIERTNRVSMSDFYARRLRRLLPLSATVTVTSLALGLWLTAPVARERLVDDAVAASLYVANWRFADQTTAYSDVEVTDSLLVHYWSLSIEEQFYVLWPLLILTGLGIARISGRSVRPVLAVLLGAVVASSLWASVRITADEGATAYYLTHTRLWEMGVGAGLALVATRLPALSTRLADGLGVAGLTAIIWAAVTYDARTPFPGSAALVPVLGCAALVVAGLHGRGVVNRVLAARPLPTIGRLSYAWYLWHWPAIGIALLMRRRWGWAWSVGATTAGAVCVSFALAWASHHLIENPVRHAPLLRRTRGPNFAMGLALTALPVVVGLGVLSVVDTGDQQIQASTGVVVRQTPAEAAADAVRFDPACHSEQSDAIVADGCEIGDPSASRTVVLLGDSHARQWVDVLDQLGRQHGWRGHAWTKSACSIIDVRVYLPASERAYDECDAWRAEVTDRVRSLGRVDTVILARSGGYRRLVLDGDRLLDPSEIAGVWSEGLERTLDTFSELADRVVLTVDPPWLSEAPPDCLSLHPDDPAACDYDLASTDRDADLIAIERPVVDDHPGVVLVDPTPLVCERDPCSVISPGGAITHRDRHHLTRTFTFEIGERFTDQLGLTG